MKIKLLKTRVNNNGQALVEFAIILIPLCLLTFGMIEFGRFLYLKNSATNAAREGARKAAVTSPWGNNSVSDVKDYIKSNSSLNLTDQNIDIIPLPPTQGQAVSVTVKTRFDSAVPDLLPIFKTLTSIRAKATMRYE